MYELHKYEQYFFNEVTINRLADFVSHYHYICCLCTPLLGQELERRGIKACTLDIDSRFATLRGYRQFDLTRPEWLGENYGLIVCDPPFFNVSLYRLSNAIRILSRYDYTQPLLIFYLARRAASLMGTFSRFGLERVDFRPGYLTAQASERNDVALFGNLGPEANTRLAGWVISEAAPVT